MRFVYVAYKRGQFPYETGADLYLQYNGKWVPCSKVPSETFKKALADKALKPVETRQGSLFVVNLTEVYERFYAVRLALQTRKPDEELLKALNMVLEQLRHAINMAEYSELKAVISRLYGAEASNANFELPSSIIEAALLAYTFQPETIYCDRKVYERFKAEILKVSKYLREGNWFSPVAPQTKKA
ncbi:MAG: hypothetical protein QXD73_04390 [Candidatus Bathyarchaeia archaeon]